MELPFLKIWPFDQGGYHSGTSKNLQHFHIASECEFAFIAEDPLFLQGMSKPA